MHERNGQRRVLAEELGDVDLTGRRPGAVGQLGGIEPEGGLQSLRVGAGDLGADLEQAVGLVKSWSVETMPLVYCV